MAPEKNWTMILKPIRVWLLCWKLRMTLVSSTLYRMLGLKGRAHRAPVRVHLLVKSCMIDASL